MCSLTAFAQRDTIALNNNWRFTTDKKAEGVNGLWFAATLPGKRIVNLPHTWNVEDENQNQVSSIISDENDNNYAFHQLASALLW
mgnify:CR=1 FL=1